MISNRHATNARVDEPASVTSPRDLAVEAIISEYGEATVLRPMLRKIALRAWRAGYGTGLADSAKFVLAEVPPPPSARVLFDALSRRQQDVVRLLLMGHRMPAVARTLGLSPSTVRNHASAAYRTLGITSESQLFALLRPGHPAGL